MSDLTETRHFVPYGSTNAACDETVPRTVAWDVSTGQYADTRFTTNHDTTTCEECIWQLRRNGVNI